LMRMGGRRRPAPAPARGPCRRRPVGLGARLCHAHSLHAAGRGNVPQRPIHARALQRPPAADLCPRTGLGRARAPSVVGPGRRLYPRTTALTARAHGHRVSDPCWERWPTPSFSRPRIVTARAAPRAMGRSEMRDWIARSAVAQAVRGRVAVGLNAVVLMNDTDRSSLNVGAPCACVQCGVAISGKRTSGCQ